MTGIDGDAVVSPLNNSHLMLLLDIIIALLVYLHDISNESLVKIFLPKLSGKRLK